MTKPILLQSAAELLEAILAGTLPADGQMEKYFRAHPKMGMRDRGFVAETVYGCLRHKRLLEHLCAKSRVSMHDLVAAHLLTQGLSARALADAGYRDDIRALTERVRTLDRNALPTAVAASLPDWLADTLHAAYGDSTARALALALAEPASLDLRANTLKATRDELARRLAAEGYATDPTPYSPVGLRRRDRAPLFKTECFRTGLFEVQDEGSQLLSLMVEPRRGEMVVDFCAGAGGKTLHLGALMANSGTLYALDVSSRRLDRLKPRLRRAGLSNVRAVTIEDERDARVQRLYGKVDRVLVDAPCTGTGTLRRNPDIKWRDLDLTIVTARQRRILAAASHLLKPGGRLVYATCSLLPAENDAVVNDFLATHPEFTMLPAAQILARRHVTLDLPEPVLRLFPHVHHTDGFYAAALIRQA